MPHQDQSSAHLEVNRQAGCRFPSIVVSVYTICAAVGAAAAFLTSRPMNTLVFSCYTHSEDQATHTHTRTRVQLVQRKLREAEEFGNSG